MKRHWTTNELIDDWTLTPDELGHVGKKTGATRLSFALPHWNINTCLKPSRRAAAPADESDKMARGDPLHRPPCQSSGTFLLVLVKRLKVQIPTPLVLTA